MTATATPPTTPPTKRPCACWTRIDPITHGGHCCFGLEAPEDCHDDVLTAAARTTGPARFYRLPPGEKRDVLAQAIARPQPDVNPCLKVSHRSSCLYP